MPFSDKIEELSQRLDNLLEKAEIWQMIFDTSPIPAAIVSEDMSFFMVNEGFLELTGFTKAEIISEDISVVVPKYFRRRHRRVEGSEKDCRGQSILSKHREEIPVELSMTSFEYESRKYYSIFIRKTN